MNENMYHISINIAELLPRFIEAICIGLLIGLERERKRKDGDITFGGIRTSPLISILGFIAALAAEHTNDYVFIAVFLAFAMLLAVSYKNSGSNEPKGATTEISFLIVFMLGALVYWKFMLLSAMVAVVLMVFLAFKPQFRSFAFNLEDEDVYATVKFAIITVIILPLLPDQTYDPFEVLNPRKIWYLVILIAGINFIGYILFKLIGARKGIFLLSVLGGIASSTATTLSFTEQSKNAPALSRSFAAGIVLASTIMFPRILLIIYFINSSLAVSLIPHTTVLLVIGLTVSFFLFRTKTKAKVDDIQLANPFRLMFAVKFGLIFAAILFVSGMAQHYFGDSGIYISSFLSGFADVDAVALSLSEFSGGKIGVDVAIKGILIAFLSNSLVKSGIAAFFGAKEIRKYALIGFVPIIIFCGVVFFI